MVAAQIVDQTASRRMEHRQGTTDDPSGLEVNLAVAGIDLRVLRDLRFHFSSLTAGTSLPIR
jgi:hypothetical protein